MKVEVFDWQKEVRDDLKWNKQWESLCLSFGRRKSGILQSGIFIMSFLKFQVLGATVFLLAVGSFFCSMKDGLETQRCLDWIINTILINMEIKNKCEFVHFVHYWDHVSTSLCPPFQDTNFISDIQCYITQQSNQTKQPNY